MKPTPHLLELFFIVFLSIDASSSFSQVALVCNEGEYRFKWHGQFFKDKSRAYACDYSLPDTLGVVDHSGNLITQNITWTNATAIVPGLGWSNTAKITLTSMQSGGITVTASFLDSYNEPHALELEIEKTIDLSYKDFAKASKFELDPNIFSAYPTYTINTHSGLPVKFLLKGSSDYVKTQPKPKKGFYSPSYVPDNIDLKLQPYRFSDKGDSLSLIYDSNLPNDTLLTHSYGCGLPPELFEFIGDSIIKTVDFVFLYDTSGKCKPKSLDCANLITQANKVYNKIGLFLKLGKISVDTPLVQLSPSLPAYFDIEFEDNDKVFSPHEQYTFANYYRTNSAEGVWVNDYLVMLVNDLGHKVEDGKEKIILGRATSFTGLPEIRNSVAIDTWENVNGNILAHEIGHGAFALWHPDTDLNVSELNGIVVHDKESFMYSTTSYYNNSIRAYQFIKIHGIR